MTQSLVTVQSMKPTVRALKWPLLHVQYKSNRNVYHPILKGVQYKKVFTFSVTVQKGKSASVHASFSCWCGWMELDGMLLFYRHMVQVLLVGISMVSLILP